MPRTILAFLLAPFPAALIQSIMVALWPKEGMGVFENPASMFVAICIYFYFFGLVLGIPATILLGKRGSRGLRHYAVAGLIVALVPVTIALSVAVIDGGSSAYIVVYNLIFFGLGGLMAGSLFWRISRPDQHPPMGTAAKA